MGTVSFNSRSMDTALIPWSPHGWIQSKYSRFVFTLQSEPVERNAPTDRDAHAPDLLHPDPGAPVEVVSAGFDPPIRDRPDHHFLQSARRNPRPSICFASDPVIGVAHELSGTVVGDLSAPFDADDGNAAAFEKASFDA